MTVAEGSANFDSQDEYLPFELNVSDDSERGGEDGIQLWKKVRDHGKIPPPSQVTIDRCFGIE